MSAPLSLVLFDVDGTLVDSQNHIVAAMEAAFARHDLPAPSRAQVLSIVGLSLPKAMAALDAQGSAARQAALVQAYKDTYMAQRQNDGVSPLYPGARETLDALHARDEVLLGVATGMSRRGLDHVIAAHGLAPLLLTRQTADDHPSKPHPAMVLAAMNDLGVAPARTVFVGDTIYDIEAGLAAKVFTIGVTWGYHSADDLRAAGAHRVVSDFAALIPAIEELWKDAR